MSSETGWLKMLLVWSFVLLVSRCSGHEGTVEGEVLPVAEEQDQAEDRAVGGNYRPSFDPAYSVPNSHGNFNIFFVYMFV